MNRLFSDEELNRAASQVRERMLDGLTEGEGEEFTPAFHRRMEALMAAEEKRQRRNRAFRRMTAAAAALVLAFSTVLTLNTEARAAVSTWFKEVLGNTTYYWFTEEKLESDEEQKLPVYIPTYIPEGYDVIKEEHRGRDYSVIYQNGEDITSAVAFQYGMMDDGRGIYVGSHTDAFHMEDITVNGCPGELYVSHEAGEAHVLVWFDEEEKLYFFVTALFDTEEILRIAESVEIIKNN